MKADPTVTRHIPMCARPSRRIMAPQHGFLFDAPVRFVAGIALVAGGVWASTIGTAPAIVKAKG
eukprot:CAMPEP_0181182116 /NCGR_PEP_ID=MMETSP1096-20121128/7715_1 /TAXON_ID=156174 ORGANISM="Chrysochromulina ericina, Strain CCMP281" /NCGR_SAMPLE_ID=MMETSP1096 /ASSEMBLY_ACC=CAM_ASM_000453 /LENGTH=63 /DNA_ID=CAMNT_0023270697 /DNA_START=64 /DNA_END=255 /DNA_ORIENTATION=+